MIQLSDHFDYKRLIRFTLPSIFSMIIGSVYSIVDGFFVSNFVGKTPFTALNNGGVASVLSFLRLVVYQGGFVMLLPAVFGINGIWNTMTVANTCSAVTALIFIAAYRKIQLLKQKVHCSCNALDFLYF